MRASIPYCMRRFSTDSFVVCTMSLAKGVGQSNAAIAFTHRHASQKNPYKVLGIKPNATKAEIKKAHRIMAAKHHPDIGAGGSEEKFLEIQEAYEQLKTGVWIQKDGNGDSAAGGGGGGNRYSNFRYTRGGKNGKVSYDDVYADMRGAGRKNDFGEDAEDPDAARRKGAPAGNEVAVQAWFRFIILWASMFVSLRMSLFFMFPPKHQHAPKKPMPDKPRKPPPPKPLAHSPMIA